MNGRWIPGHFAVLSAAMTAMLAATALASPTQVPPDASPELRTCLTGTPVAAITACTVILQDPTLPAPKKAEAYHARGVAMRANGDIQRSIDNMTLAIKLEPSSAQFWNSRGLSYGLIGRYDEALQDFAQAVSIDPQDGDGFYNMGLVYYLKGDDAKSLAQYDRAAALKPNTAEILGNRCLTRLRMRKDLAAAMADCDLAVKIDRQHVVNLGIRALGHFLTSAPDKATADCAAALAIYPKDSWCLWIRGSIQIQAGNAAAGRKDIAAAKSYEPNIAMRLSYFRLPQ
jgi:tetratricopeptide (TPR) repeat protein